MDTSTEYRIETESPAGPELLFWSIVGLEAMSQPSVYELRVLSTNDAISPSDILGHAFDVVFGFKDADDVEHERHCRGHAVRFARRGMQGRFYEYALELQSWFGLLEKRFNARIHQELNVLEVLDATIDDSPLSGLKKLNRDGITGSPEPRSYCVQFQESDFQFLSRLLEEEGIYYWFDAHDAPGTMYLANASDAAHSPLPAAAEMGNLGPMAQTRRFNEVSRTTAGTRLASGRHASQDSDFKAIRRKLAGSSSDAAEHELADLEVFEFPGGHLRNADADKLSRIRMEELASRRQLYWSVTAWPDVTVGRTLSFHRSYGVAMSQEPHLILSCLVHASHPGYEGTDNSVPAELGPKLLALLAQDRINEEFRAELAAQIAGDEMISRPRRGARFFLFTSIPVGVAFRPPRTTPRVRMPGPQSAIVVGRAGRDIDADEFGRVKVHFHWDRYDQSDEKSTCWVRVSQPWAGKGWGAYFAPRIGQEVIVDFLNGDPDRPIIMGRVYNSDQPIPFDSHTQSGFKTRSTPQGSSDNCNELRFEDKKGGEQVFLHAEKNLDIEVENNETHWVGHDRKKTVDHDETNVIKNDRTETVGVNEHISVGQNRTEVVGANEDISIGVNRTESVGADESITIGANRTTTVVGDDTSTVGGNQTITVSGSRTDTVAASFTQSVGASLTQAVGASITTSVGGAYTISAAGGMTVLAPAGVTHVDSFFSSLGGNLLEQYNSIVKFTPVSIEGTGFKAEACGIKIDEGGLLNRRVGTVMKNLGVKIENSGPVMKKAAVVLQKAGIYMIG